MFVLSVMLSFVFTRLVRNQAVKRGWVVAAVSKHHLHIEPVPRLGGIAIFASFVLAAAVVLGGAWLLRPDLNLPLRTVLYIIGSGSLVFLLGLFDDFRQAKPSTKFAVQAVAATILFSGGFGVFRMPLLFGSYEAGWVGLPLTILWCLWITNAFNLIDGVDGLAAGSALFSTLAVFVVSLTTSNPIVSLLALGLAGAILGFLRFNFNPATIFLGDCGSLFVGFVLSALGAAGAQKAPTIVAVAIPVVSFGLPILETAISVIRRWLSGQPLFGADTQHIHHKLLQRGFSQRQVVIMLYGVSAVFALLSVFLLYPGGTTVGMVLFVTGAIIWTGVQHLGYHEFVELGRVASRTFEQKRIIVNNLAIRRATEALGQVTSLAQLRSVMSDAFQTSDFDGYKLMLHRVERRNSSRGGQTSTGEPIVTAAEFVPLLEWQKAEVEGEAAGRSKNRRGKAQLPEAHWTLRLDLVTEDGRRLGSFTLYRRYNYNSLPLDVNLLIVDFPRLLAQAVDRLSIQSEATAGDEDASRFGGNRRSAIEPAVALTYPN
jgi:UDP-GlcNAc:undecaprenyl-phosphate GlcNAc-1-phosphate transferase